MLESLGHHTESLQNIVISKPPKSLYIAFLHSGLLSLQYVGLSILLQQNCKYMRLILYSCGKTLSTNPCTNGTEQILQTYETQYRRAL